MMSPLDVEAAAAAPEDTQKVVGQPSKPSFARKWGPAMIAIAVVVAINAALLGPSGSKIPALTERHEAARELREARTQAVLDMDYDPEADLKRGRDTASTLRDVRRSLSATDSAATSSSDAVLEYTRRRHRVLGDYTHVDVSDQFTAFGKWSVTVIYFAYWVFLMFPNWFLPIGRPGIALGGGLTMVVWRYILFVSGQGPVFDAERVIIMEPLFLLFGLMLTTIYLEKMERGGLFDKLRDSLDDPISWKRSAKIMAMSTIGSAAVMNDSVVLIFSGVVVDLCVRHKVSIGCNDTWLSPKFFLFSSYWVIYFMVFSIRSWVHMASHKSSSLLLHFNIYKIHRSPTPSPTSSRSPPPPTSVPASP